MGHRSLFTQTTDVVTTFLDEDDLRAFGHVHEVRSSNNFVNTGQEVIVIQSPHIHGHLATVHIGTSV